MFACIFHLYSVFLPLFTPFFNFFPPLFSPFFVFLAEVDFKPNEDDMIMTRVRTTGIVVTEVKEAPFTYQGIEKLCMFECVCFECVHECV